MHALYVCFNVFLIRIDLLSSLFQIGKKGYVQLQTTLGNLNIELHCDIAMRTCWNFVTLCNKGFYDGLTFHRLVPDFMIQTGDPTGEKFHSF